MENLRARWQSQPVESQRMSAEEIRTEAQRFQKRIRRRNIQEYFASTVTAAIFGAEIWFIKFPMGVRVGLSLIIVGVLSMIYQMRKRASSRAVPSDLASTSCLEFHRRELARQRDTLQTFWIWGLLPLVPGILVVVIAFVLAPRGWVASLVFGGLTASLLIYFGRLNQLAARQLQRKIDDLGG
jgi:predicted phage tail protein